MARCLQALFLEHCLCLRLACAFAGRCQLFGYLKSLTGFQGLDLTTHLVLLGLQCLCTLISPSALMLCCVQVPAQSGDAALRAVLSQLRAGIITGRQPRSIQRKLLLRTVQAFRGAVGLLDTFFFDLNGINALDRPNHMRGGLSGDLAQ